jgi:methionine-S-sulfoxide reductase
VFLAWILFGTPRGFTDETVRKKAVFAGGCFWCVEHDFDAVPGVISTTSGFAGGSEKNPTYEQAASGNTGHAESVEVLYDSSQVTYEKLLDVFWKMIDPTTLDRQFVDVGRQYRTVIFYQNEEEKRLALASKEKLEKSGPYQKPIVTEIVPLIEFYPAEEYHQDFYRKNKGRYESYRFFSGRNQFLKKIWGKEKVKVRVVSGKS